jgi:hypothetical protein
MIHLVRRPSVGYEVVRICPGGIMLKKIMRRGWLFWQGGAKKSRI